MCLAITLTTITKYRNENIVNIIEYNTHPNENGSLSVCPVRDFNALMSIDGNVVINAPIPNPATDANAQKPKQIPTKVATR